MASFDISFLPNSSSPPVISLDVITPPSLTIGATTDGKPNKPTPPWREQPPSCIDSSSDDSSQDMLLGGQDSNYWVGSQENDLLFNPTEADMLTSPSQTGLEGVENFTDWQSLLNWAGEFQSELISIQQVGQNLGICCESNSLMLLNNLDATLLASADIVTSV